MYYLNKIVWFFLNPIVLPLAGILFGLLLVLKCRVGRSWRRVGGGLIGVSVALLWFESTLTCVCLLGLPLERPYLATQTVESLPNADAIVVLGGGMSKSPKMAYPDMFEAADRVWHAARLWKAGKAPKVVVSGSNDQQSTVPLLLDLGVPKEAVVVDNASRNTYENSRFTERILYGDDPGAEPREHTKTVLLVTSAWHMPRACGNFSKTALKVVPAACDFSANNVYHGAGYWWDWIAPTSDSMARSYYLFKEWLGKLARK